MSLPFVGSDRRRAFAEALSFELDAFQVEAMDVIDAGDNVLVERTDRLGQDLGRCLRRHRCSGTRGEDLLHHAAQGALEPEVRRAGG